MLGTARQLALPRPKVVRLDPWNSIAIIMAKGEWRQAAVLTYWRPEDAHTASFVAKALEDSDAERNRAQAPPLRSLASPSIPAGSGPLPLASSMPAACVRAAHAYPRSERP